MTFGVTACAILCASGARTIAAGERTDDDLRHFRQRLARLESLIEKQRQTLQIPGSLQSASAFSAQTAAQKCGWSSST
jgi:hypothetical protein